MSSPGSVEFLFAKFRLDPGVPCLYRVDETGETPEEPVEVGQRALALLHSLVKRKGHVASKIDICREVWDKEPWELDAWNIHVQISELRKVLGHDSIETRARTGYRIAVKVIERKVEPPPERENAITTLYGL